MMRNRVRRFPSRSFQYIPLEDRWSIVSLGPYGVSDPCNPS